MGPNNLYFRLMMRVLTTLLWLCVALVFSFDAVAQPCDVRDELMSHHEAPMAEAMPCHAGMEMPADQMDEEVPQQGESCCCAALLPHSATLNHADLSTPLSAVLVWAEPLPEHADSISFEYEPPPPRA